MQFCKLHWEKLREAIKARGLDDLVPKNGADAKNRLIAETQGARNMASFDPLMSAHNNIIGNALKRDGLIPTAQMMMGDNCPLCMLNAAASEHQKRCTTPGCTVVPSYDKWIDNAADDELAEYRKRSAQVDA